MDSAGDAGSSNTVNLAEKRKSVVNIRGLPELIELNDQHDSDHDHSDHSSRHDEEHEDLCREELDEFHIPPSAPWLEYESPKAGGPNASLPPKSGSSGTQAASRSHCSATHTPGKQQWCYVGTAFPRNEDMWRTPGHQDDATTPEVAQRRERELQNSARLAGEFLAGSRGRSPLTSTFMTSTIEAAMSSTLSRRAAPPAHNPYDGGWLGAAPQGSWIIYNGRPRCVDAEQISSREASLANTTGSSEFRRGPGAVHVADSPVAAEQRDVMIAPPVAPPVTVSIDVLEPSRSPIVGGLSLLGGSGGLAPSPSPCATPMRRMSCLRGSNIAMANEAAAASAALAGIAVSTRSSSTSSSESEDFEVTLARSCLGEDAKKALEERKERRRFEKLAARRQSRVNFDNAALDQQCVEDIQDILQHLEDKDKESARNHARPAIPRFSWIPPATNGLPPSPRGDGRMTLLFPQSPHGGESPGMQRVSSMGSSIGAGASRSSVMSLGGQGHHGHRVSVLNKRESHLLKGPTGRLNGVPMARCSIGEHKRHGVTVNRDLKAEIKRMKETLLSSAQNAFGNDVWERCGIESEHIKKQQLAQLIHGGLGGLFKKKDPDAGAFGQDQQDSAGHGSSPETPGARRRSMKRASAVGGAGVAAQSSMGSEQARSGQRKSVVKTGGPAKRRQSNAPPSR